MIFSRFAWFYLASDDSYIYLGYVKNMVRAPHTLFSYNLGEHSGATTSVLYYYLLIVTSLPFTVFVSSVHLQDALMLGHYVLNAGLFIVLGAVFLSLCARIAALNELRPELLQVLGTLLFFAHPDFLWGEFSGLEGPLAALLLLLFAQVLLQPSRMTRLAIISALLVATRPELLPVCAPAPAVALLIERRWGSQNPLDPLSVQWQRLAIAYALFLGTVIALYLPLRLTTGSWAPAAAESRVHLTLASDPAEFLLRIWSMRSRYWVLISAALVFANFCAWSETTTRRHLPMGLFLCAYFAVRALFGLTDLNIRDRYVSYFWPVIVVTMLGLASPTIRAMWRSRPRTRPVQILVAVFAFGCLAAGSVWGARVAVVNLAADTEEMMEVVVHPSQWMQKNLPPGSRVSMEPAGAIRFFTDLYLVDAMGLTTQHTGGLPIRSLRRYLTLMDKNHVEYVFDYPARLRFLPRYPRFKRLKYWKVRRRWSLGNIGLFRYLPVSRPAR